MSGHLPLRDSTWQPHRVKMDKKEDRHPAQLFCCCPISLALERARRMTRASRAQKCPVGGCGPAWSLKSGLTLGLENNLLLVHMGKHFPPTSNMWGRRSGGWWVCCGQQVHPCMPSPAWIEDVLLLPMRSETCLQQARSGSFIPFILHEDLNSHLH